MVDILKLLIALVAIGAVLTKLEDRKKNKKILKSGKDGEEIVNNFLSKQKGVLMKDLLFNLGNDKYAQIDHLFITDKAIFVIETKNHKGHIYGTEEQQQWTVAYGKKKFNMYNPLIQNKKHVDRVREVLNDYKVKVIPVTVFSNDRVTFENSIKGTYTMINFISNFNKIVNIRGNNIDSKGYIDKLKKLDVSKSRKHRKNQIAYAQKNKRK